MTKTQNIGTREAAEILQVSESSVKRWTDDGQIPSYKTAGGHRRYRLDDLLRFRDRQSGAALHERLASMTPEQLNALDVGVIQLGDDGKVLFYNTFESKFAGYSSEEVVGKNFFGHVAPCTNNRLVMGRFMEGVRTGQMDEEIVYTFTYRMRPTVVVLRLYRDPQSATNWMTVVPRGPQKAEAPDGEQGAPELPETEAGSVE